MVAPFRRLRRLKVEALDVSGSLVAKLLTRFRSPRLRALSLWNVRLEDCFSSGETAAEFFAEVGVPRLRRLSLWSNGLATGVSTLAPVLRPAADTLVELGIGANGLTGRGVCTLVDGLQPERLWLTKNPLGTEGLRQVAKRVDAARLNEVAVAGCKLDDAGGEALARWLEGSQLRHSSRATTLWASAAPSPSRHGGTTPSRARCCWPKIALATRVSNAW